MVNQVINIGSFHWLDLVNPSAAELEQVAQRYQLHPTSVADCLDPEHLPKFEKIGSVTFLITRTYDETASPDADTVQELTRKVAFFIGDTFLITVHRRDQAFISKMREKWTNGQDGNVTLAQIISELLRGVILSYEKPIDDAICALESMETRIFRGEVNARIMQEGYFLKRKAYIFKRMLRMQSELVPRLGLGDAHAPWIQDLRENADGLYFYAEDIVESVLHLLNMYISLQGQKTNEASHRTNEVMRVLTVFSVFFMPLNFIAGVYGMNFEHMPELRNPYAYPVVLTFMVVISLSIWLWFRRKGWLK